MSAMPPPPPPQVSVEAGVVKFVAEGEDEKKKNWLPTSLDILDNKAPSPHELTSAQLAQAKAADIDHIQWTKVSAFCRSGVGSAGVFFVKVPEGVAVVKGCDSVVEEVFAALLAERVGIRVPRVRVLEYTSREWRQAKWAIRSKAEAADPTGVDALKVEKELDRPFIMVMEFVKGKDLEQLGPQAKSLFESPDGPRLFREMGRLVCLDIVTNNWDRLPIIWDNDGNFRNLYLEQREGKDHHRTKWSVVGIDQGITAVKREVHPEGHDKYMSRVESLVVHIATRPGEEAEELQRFRDCIRTELAIDLRPSDSLEIQAGILETVKEFAKLEEKDLVEMKHKVEHMIRTDWADVWAKGLESIHIPMLMDVIDIYKRALSLPPQPAATK